MTEDDGYTTIHCSGVDMAQWKDPIQAARNEALEEAARVLDRHDGAPMKANQMLSFDLADYYVAGQLHAGIFWQDAIRALKDTPEGDT